jgi:flavin-dependent dehydrogenase
MPETFDVVVVGARCAGSPLAAMLARNGAKVTVVEQATFPRDTLSSHTFQADALAFLDRLGLTEQLRATGAPFVKGVDGRSDDFAWSIDWPQRPGDVGGLACIRRFVLDPILADAAAEAGADVRLGTRVTGVEHESGRVVGVRVSSDGKETNLRARLIVGADGRNSTIARLCGARKYNVTPNQRFAYWTYFEGADVADHPFVYHRWDDRLIVASPTDSGLYMVNMFPDLAERDRFRQDLETSFMEYAQSCEPVARTLVGARRAGKFLGIVRWVGYFREASGPGWVLVGDAGHFKDPSAGRGIGDAFCQVDALAPAIIAGLDGSAGGLDDSMARWGRWRDRDFAEHYWLVTDMGRAGRQPAAVPQILRRLHERGKMDQVMNLFTHRSRPSKVLKPARLFGATGRLLRERGRDRRGLLREARMLVAEEAHRRLLNKRPDFATAGAMGDDAGPTEIEHSGAA